MRTLCVLAIVPLVALVYAQTQRDAQLSEVAVLKLRVADLQQQLAASQADVAILRKQVVEADTIKERAAILGGECERAKIPLADCRYDPNRQAVFSLPTKASGDTRPSEQPAARP